MSLPTLPAGVISCCDPTCSSHSSAISKFIDSLVLCLRSASVKTLPIFTPSFKRKVPGWNDKARLLKQQADIYGIKSGLMLVFLYLGFWQKSRKKQKLDLNMKSEGSSGKRGISGGRSLLLPFSPKEKQNFGRRLKRPGQPNRAHVIFLLMVCSMQRMFRRFLPPNSLRR